MSATEWLYVELVVRPSRRPEHQQADIDLQLVRRESNQGVLNPTELRVLQQKCRAIKCDQHKGSRHACVRIRTDMTEKTAPYVEVIYNPACFPGNAGGRHVRHLAANEHQQARARTYKQRMEAHAASQDA